MTITATGLTKAAGIAAATAGAIFIAVQINHPAFDTYLTDTDEWVMRCSAKAAMTVLALVGLTGIYLRQVRQMKVLGLIGYIVFGLGYLMMFATEVMAVAFLSALTDKAPAFVNDVVVASGGGHPAGDIGSLQTFFDLTGACYLLGGLIFGVAALLVRWLVVLPLKGAPFAEGLQAQAVTVYVGFHLIFGIGLALLFGAALALARRSTGVAPKALHG